MPERNKSPMNPNDATSGLLYQKRKQFLDKN